MFIAQPYEAKSFEYSIANAMFIHALAESEVRNELWEFPTPTTEGNSELLRSDINVAACRGRGCLWR